MARRLIRKRFIIGLFLVLLAGLIFSPNPWRDKAAGWGMRKVFHRALGREVEWRSLRVLGLPPHLEVRDLRIAPFVKVRFLNIAPSTTLTSSSIFISGLELDLSGELGGGGAAKGQGPPLPILFFHRLTITDATLKLKETAIPLSGDFEQVSLFTSGERGFLWVRRGMLGILDYPPVELSLRAGFRPEGGGLKLEPLFLSGPDFSIEGTGRFAAGDPALEFDLAVDAAARPWMDRFGLGLDGTARARLRTALRIGGGRFHLEAEGPITEAALFGHPLEPLAATCAIELEGPRRVLEASLKGARGLLTSHMDLHPPVRIDSSLELNAVSLARLLETFSVPVPAYDLPVDARAEFSFAGSAVGEGTGSVTAGDPEGRLRFEAGMRGLGFEFFTARLIDAGLDLDAVGTIPFDNTHPVDIRGALHSSDLGALQQFLSPFLPAFGDLSGCVAGRFAVDRTFADPRLEVEARVEGARLYGLEWGSGPVAFTVTGEDPFAVSGLDLALGGGTIRAAGSLGTGFRFRFEEWPWTHPLPVTLSGTGTMALEPALDIRGEVERAVLPWLPLALDRVHGDFSFDGEKLTIHSLTAGAEAGEFAGSAEVTDAFHLKGSFRDFPLAEGVEATGDLRADFGAALTGEARLTVTGASPPFPLTVEADLGERDGRLRVGTAGFGTLDARLAQRGGGRLAVDGTLEGMTLAGLPAQIDPPVAAAVRIVGDPFDLASWSGEVRLPPLEFLQEEMRFRVPQGIALDLKDGAATLGSTAIEHDWGFLEVSGALRLAEGFPFDIDLKADFGDDLVQHLLPDLEYSGFASMDLRASRRERSLELSGGLRLDGFFLKVRPLRLILDKPEARVTFQRNRVSLDRLEARTGEGRFSARGEAFLDQRGGLLAANVAFQGDDLLLRYPEGFRLLLDGGGELVLTPESKTLSAKVTLEEGLYSRDIDLVAELKKALSSAKVLPQASRLPDIRLAVEISIPGTLQFNNQLLEVAGSGRLQIVGTLPRPVVLGALETLPGSRVNFGGVQYQIIRATVQFNNPHAFDPSIDLLAEATVQSYLVRLALTGPVSRLQTRLSSTPYLTEADIFSLLATGSPGRENQQAVATGAASLLVSQQLSQRLTRSTSSLLGVDRVRIDPVMGETSIAGARLTLSKQITRDCLFSYTYTSDVTKQDIVSLECTVAGNAFLNLMQEEDGSYSLQLLKREKF